MKSYEIIIIGGGHAGIEAALATSRMKIRSLLVTMNRDNIGAMPCNPAIGGVAKGHLVKEIDAFGGEMGRAADDTCIHFRRLNTKKGAAVRSSRAQTDKYRYKKRMRQSVCNAPYLDLLEAEVATIITKNGYFQSIQTQDKEIISGRAVIITTGTSLHGKIHFGMKAIPAARLGDKPANALSQSLRNLGLRMGRLKTGTNPRLDARTIDFEKCIVQHGDKEILPFSLWTDTISLPQVNCHITRTNPRTHRIIQDNLDRSPMYTGKIDAVGPRYCPSIEDKVVRFPEKDHHQIFLEPEGLNTNEIYCNGISTSLPIGVQRELVQTIQGLENATILKYGYAVEYEFIDARQLTHTLAYREIPNIFFAGQINGTTGYEEAAAQGIMAGINAALAVRHREPLILDRSDAYIAVLIDDLITQGTSEPYRMFTSRAEHRLLLREDNAWLRLMDTANRIGVLEDARYDILCQNRTRLKRAKSILSDRHMVPNPQTTERLQSLGFVAIDQKTSFFDYLKKMPYRYTDLLAIDPSLPELPPRLREIIETDSLYEGYIAKERLAVEQMRIIEHTPIPDQIDYHALHGLSNELKGKLNQVRPATLGQASRIQGITPVAINVLMIHLKRLAADKSITAPT